MFVAGSIHQSKKWGSGFSATTESTRKKYRTTYNTNKNVFTIDSLCDLLYPHESESGLYCHNMACPVFTRHPGDPDFLANNFRHPVVEERFNFILMGADGEVVPNVEGTQVFLHGPSEARRMARLEMARHGWAPFRSGLHSYGA